MSNVVDRIELTEVEQDVIVEHFKCPVLRKYFKALAVPLLEDLCTADPDTGESAEEFVRRQQHHRGQLALINHLLTITKE